MAKRRRRVSRTEARDALGLSSVRALDKLVERGAPAPTGKLGTKRYDVDAIEKWRAARAARTAPTRDLATERAELAHAQMLLTRLRYRRERGEFVRTVDVVDIFRAAAAATKTQLLAVPRRAVLEGLPRKWERLARRLITAALRELSEADTLEALHRLARAAKSK